jgi:hypothetical protein
MDCSAHREREDYQWSGSRASSVGIATGDGPRYWTAGVGIPAGVNISLYNAQIGSTSYPVGTEGSFPWVKVAGV